MTIKIRSEETCTESKFFYHNQDVTYNYHLDMIDNGINIWTSIHGRNSGLLPFVFQSFPISSEEDVNSFYKYIKLIDTGCYVAILISGNLPFHCKKITKAMKLVGGGKMIESLSDSNPNFCLIGYKGQKSGSARQAIGDADIEEDGGISVWMMTSKNRCLFKNRLLINIRNKTPLLGSISQLYKKHIKKEMTNNIYL